MPNLQVHWEIKKVVPRVSPLHLKTIKWNARTTFQLSIPLNKNGSMISILRFPASCLSSARSARRGDGVHDVRTESLGQTLRQMAKLFPLIRDGARMLKTHFWTMSEGYTRAERDYKECDGQILVFRNVNRQIDL